jgi:serine/threonine protein kinase
MMPAADRRLGRFVIQRKLGRGGMADVYLATDTAGGYTVALKLIEHADDADTRDSIEAERRGAFLQARLADVDPNVVRVYDCGDVNRYFFVAMEYVEGQDLADQIRAGSLPPRHAAAIAATVCATLGRAHALETVVAGKSFHGIVHGDIKPKNIRIQTDGRVRVLDFGIAKALSLSRRLTRNEFGSVPYASPERLDSGDVNAQSDLWSLAVMLYEMAAGLQPFVADTTERLEQMIRSRVPPPPAPSPCPEPLRRILIKALAPDPEARYRDAGHFTADLEAFLAGQPVEAEAEAEDDDPDATRRTVRTLDTPDEDSDATRRTQRPEAQPAPPPPPVRPTAARRQWWDALGLQARRAVAVAAGLVLLWLLWITISEYRMWSSGRDLSRSIAAEQITDPDQIWAKWSELSRGHSSSLLLWGVRGAVKDRLVAAADKVIATFRMNDAQTVFEKDWTHARTLLGHALEADPGDESVRGRLRLVEGHLERINGTAKRNGAMLNEAVAKFTEAQQMMPRSPDPQLGLARVYVYGLKDIDRGWEALQQAEKRGFKLGNREKSLLADGYRDRGDRLWWDSRNVRGLPQEKDQIKRAAEDYGRALSLYQSIAPWGSSAAGIRRVQQSLESVTVRLQQVQEGTPVGGHT